jgi:copper chaperone
MKEVTFTVPAIHCEHCTHTIEMELGEIKGVGSVQADSATKQVIVSFEDPATKEKLIAGLDEINYPPSPEV